MSKVGKLYKVQFWFGANFFPIFVHLIAKIQLPITKMVSKVGIATLEIRVFAYKKSRNLSKLRLPILTAFLE